MIVVTAKAMQRLDQRTVHDYGIPSLTLMERAGTGVCHAMEAAFGPLKERAVVVLAGKGHNGGDGLVAARHLHERGAKVQVVLLAPEEAYRDDARTNLDRFRRLGGRLVSLDRQDLAGLRETLAQADVIVDAIFGTGLASPITPPLADVIALMNASGRPIVAVDLPSGVHADTGEILGVAGVAVRARLTVTVAPPKQGLYLYPAADCVGALTIVDIGIPAALIKQAESEVEVLTEAEVAAALPPRPAEAHKGTFGHVGVIAGSAGMAGAAALTARAALRTGAGLVTVAHPAGLTIDRFAPEVMTRALPATRAGTLSLKAKAACLEFGRDKTVLAIGPGLALHRDTQRLIRAVLERLDPIDRPVVLDADGLNALAGSLGLLTRLRAPAILTPHPGEMARLTYHAAAEVQRNRLAVARAFAVKHAVVLVLKGARTVVAAPSGRLFINPTGNPGMATAGAGDVLTGIIAGLVAQGLDPLRAATTGVFVHGLAGDLARDRRGVRGLLASDLIEEIPMALTRLAGLR